MNLMENWAIVKIIGGVSVILISFFTLFGKLIPERAKIIWARNASSELQNLKANLDNHNLGLNNLAANHIFHIQNIHNKKIESIEKLWSAILEIK